MARPTVGAVIEHEGKNGRIYRSLRFMAYGKRRHIALGPVRAAEAERELRHVVADVERGTWKPRSGVTPPPEAKRCLAFHEFSAEWWVRVEKELAESTRADYRWPLEVHLLDFFADMRLNEITFDTVERYIAAKLAEEKPLSSRSINMTVTLLGSILERAVERELIPRNPARGRDRRVRERAPTRSYLDNALQIGALLDASAELDRTADKDKQHIERKAMIAALMFAGLRIGELCALRWRHVDLATGWLTVGESKTDAGRRRVKIRGLLRDELLAVAGPRRGEDQEAFVFGTRSDAEQSAENFRNRPLKAAVKSANESLAKRKLAPLPEKLTPHSRRTFCSLLYALGEDPGTVMDEMGHTDPALALRVYRQAMRRHEGEKAQLQALLEGEIVAVGGRRAENRDQQHSHVDAAAA
jgi:integrase